MLTKHDTRYSYLLILLQVSDHKNILNVMNELYPLWNWQIFYRNPNSSKKFEWIMWSGQMKIPQLWQNELSWMRSGSESDECNLASYTIFIILMNSLYHSKAFFYTNIYDLVNSYPRTTSTDTLQTRDMWSRHKHLAVESDWHPGQQLLQARGAPRSAV